MVDYEPCDTPLSGIEGDAKSLDGHYPRSSRGFGGDGGPMPERRPRTASADFAQQIVHQIPFLRRAAGRWHWDKADADDLVQDTLARALANAHLWQPGSDLRAWLFTIMRHQFLAGVAKSSRAAAKLSFYATSDLATGKDPCEMRLVLRDVGAVLRRLPIKQRTVLLLAGIEGGSYDEVAAAMSLSVDAVRSHLARARERLRTAMGSESRTPGSRRSARLPPPRASRPAFSHERSACAMEAAD
jgi:RNA polymerase sigma-70 factor (ECF subfamily)